MILDAETLATFERERAGLERELGVQVDWTPYPDQRCGSVVADEIGVRFTASKTQTMSVRFKLDGPDDLAPRRIRAMFCEAADAFRDRNSSIAA